MKKLIKTILQNILVYNNKYYILTCTRDLIEKTQLNGDTVRSNLKMLLDSNILINTGFHTIYGKEKYHNSTWILYELNLSLISIENACGNPGTVGEVEKFLKSK